MCTSHVPAKFVCVQRMPDVQKIRSDTLVYFSAERAGVREHHYQRALPGLNNMLINTTTHSDAHLQISDLT